LIAGHLGVDAATPIDNNAFGRLSSLVAAARDN
jgi:hypothetical protein